MMKFKNYVNNSLFLLMGFMLLTACDNNDEVISIETLSADEISAILKVDDITAIVDDIVELDEFDEDFSSSSGKSSVGTCVSRSVEDGDQQRIVTLDFGEGCNPNGFREFAGIIQIAYTRVDSGYTREVSFIDFYVNGNQITGSKFFSRVRTNNNGNPQSTVSVDVTIHFEKGDSYSRTGVKIREKIQGSDTPTRGDDVVSVNGNWNTVNRMGVVRSAEVTIPLIREFACRYFVSGVIELSRGEAAAIVNFGEGSCDNLASVTGSNGNTFQIEL